MTLIFGVYCNQMILKTFQKFFKNFVETKHGQWNTNSIYGAGLTKTIHSSGPRNLARQTLRKKLHTLFRRSLSGFHLMTVVVLVGSKSPRKNSLTSSVFSKNGFSSNVNLILYPDLISSNSSTYKNQL